MMLFEDDRSGDEHVLEPGTELHTALYAQLLPMIDAALAASSEPDRTQRQLELADGLMSVRIRAELTLSTGGVLVDDTLVAPRVFTTFPLDVAIDSDGTIRVGLFDGDRP